MLVICAASTSSVCTFTCCDVPKTCTVKKVFPLYDFLGWYSTGNQVLKSDIEVHKQFLEINESPIYLLLDSVAAYSPATRDLPVMIFESELHVIEDRPTMLFVKVPYRIQTGEAERIGVDYVAKVTPAGGSEDSQLTSHLLGLHNAIKMLNIRVKVLHQFLDSTKRGATPFDHNILRQVYGLCNLLPAIDTQSFKEDFLKVRPTPLICLIYLLPCRNTMTCYW